MCHYVCWFLGESSATTRIESGRWWRGRGCFKFFLSALFLPTDRSRLGWGYRLHHHGWFLFSFQKNEILSNLNRGRSADTTQNRKTGLLIDFGDAIRTLNFRNQRKTYVWMYFVQHSDMNRASAYWYVFLIKMSYFRIKKLLRIRVTCNININIICRDRFDALKTLKNIFVGSCIFSLLLSKVHRSIILFAR